MKFKKIFWIVLLSMLALPLGIGLWMWNKPHRNVQEEKPVFVGSSSDFSRHIHSANDSVRAKMMDQVIELHGQVAEFDRSGDSAVSLKLVAVEVDVMCSFIGKTAVELPALLPNQKVQLRGIFTGYQEGIPGFDMLPTITLNRCALIQNKSNK